ncbi:MAG TPA: LysM peptidoglycan-binding domain-containing protein, partial [Chloroflexi bacterium]|nr:LysM peptidoglycan-binding domain-containing protein [Chloroflexota bacterium]
MSKSTPSRTGHFWARLDQPTGDTWQLLGSLAVTLISVGMLVGGFLLSQLDGVGMRAPATHVAVLPPSPTIFWPTATPSPSPSPPPSPTLTPAAKATTTPSPSPVSSLIPSCQPPAGWTIYIVRAGDTLYRLALQSNTTELALMQANCLNTPAIYSGQRLYLPPT